MVQKIFLYKKLGENIITRNSIVSLFDKEINSSKNNEFILDFNNVRFISRSSAAEYIKLRENTDKNLIEKNMSKDIKLMFKLVVKQLRNIEPGFRETISNVKKAL